MQTFDPEVAATVLAAELSAVGSAAIDSAVRDHYAARIEALLRKAMQAERQACAAVCLQRQALWEKTETNPETPEPLSTEARFRGNEAAYLADALRERRAR